MIDKKLKKTLKFLLDIYKAIDYVEETNSILEESLSREISERLRVLRKDSDVYKFILDILDVPQDTIVEKGKGIGFCRDIFGEQLFAYAEGEIEFSEALENIEEYLDNLKKENK